MIQSQGTFTKTRTIRCQKCSACSNIRDTPETCRMQKIYRPSLEDLSIAITNGIVFSLKGSERKRADVESIKTLNGVRSIISSSDPLEAAIMDVIFPALLQWFINILLERIEK